MNTYAVHPVSPFVPVFTVRADSAHEALTKAQTAHPVHGIWPVRMQRMK